MERILFVTGPGKASIENHFDLNPELIQILRDRQRGPAGRYVHFERVDVRYFYTRQRELLGLGHAILCSRPFVGDQLFVVALGDSIIGMNAASDVVRRMIDVFAQQRAEAVIAEEVPRSDVHRYGIADPKSDGDVFELADVIEKPSVEEAPSSLAIAARYVFAPSIYDAIDRGRRAKTAKSSFTDAVRILLRERRAIGVRLRNDERRYDIGNFDSYFRAFVEFALNDPRSGALAPSPGGNAPC